MQPASKKLFGKWIFVLIGGILLVQVQSALWEWVFRPGISAAANSINNSAAEFWSDTNSTIYRNMASRVPHDSSLVMMVLLLAPIEFGLAILLRNVMGKFRFFGARFVERWSNTRLLVASLVGVLGLTMYMEVLQQRTTAGVLYFDQLMAIAAPDINHDQMVDIKSRFAQMQHRKDFDVLESELKTLILEHKQHLPPNPLNR